MPKPTESAQRRTRGDAHRLVPHSEVQSGPDPVSRLEAHALDALLAVVPAASAVFAAVTRWLDIAGGVFVQRRSATAPLRFLWRQYAAHVRQHDPFAAQRVADSGATVLTLDEVGSANGGPYAEYLAELGARDVATVYLRSAGTVVATVTLLRAHDEPPFDAHEVAQLRRMHPLLEHAYVAARERGLVAVGPGPPETVPLTGREAEVATLVGVGSTNAEIAEALSLRLATVKVHLTQIYAKLGLRSRTELAVMFGSGAGGEG